jgi:hypothetical protein
MVRLMVAALFSIVSFDASAIVRYMVQDMTCGQVQDAVERDGTAILYRQGKSGILLYDRFVRDGSLCATGYTTIRERVRVADTEDCRVTKCVEAQRFGN